MIRRRCSFKKYAWNVVSGKSPLIINNSERDSFRSFSVIGKSEQVTTTGAQLFDISKVIDSAKVKVDGNKIIVTDAQYGTSATAPNKFSDYFPKTEIGKTYILSFSDLGKSVIYLIGANMIWDNKTAKEITQEILDSTIVFYSLSTGKNVYSNIMLNEGSTAKPYEPYTGGKPSPSPDYPQEIRSVGKWNEETQKYEVEVKVTGKNLINEKSLKNFENYIKQGNTYYIYRIRGLINGVQYTLSRGDVASGNKMIFGISVNGQIYDNSSFLVYDGLGSSYNRKSITWTQNNVDYADILFSYNANQSQTTAERLKELFDRIEYIQLEYGNSPTAHEVIKKSQSVMLTSDRPVTKWDKLVEQDGQIGWLYQSAAKEYIGDNSVALYDTGFYFKISDKKIVNGEGYCKELKQYVHREENSNIAFNMSANIYVYTLNTQAIYGSTVSAIKEYLKSHPLHLAYKTEIPEFVPLPQAEQDSIRSLISYSPTTIITVDGGEVDPSVEVLCAIKEMM